MPSTSPKQKSLMAACAHGAAYKKCPPLSVAREFNQADKGTHLLKRGGGGVTPKESGMDAKMNFGLGHGNSLFSTMPLMGHALSGTQLGQADHTIRRAQRRFAEGGKVKPAGPSAKERKEIRDTIERGKNDAISALRSTRATLEAAMPNRTEPEDFNVALDRLRSQLAQPVMMADGGEVQDPNDSPMDADPTMLYQEYTELLGKLSDADLDPSLQMEIVDRLAQIEGALEEVGIDVGEGAVPEGAAIGSDYAAMPAR